MAEARTKEKAFRAAFAQLGQLRSLTPAGTGITCLTATATANTRLKVWKLLGVKQASTKEIYVSPDRDNIKLTMTKVTQQEVTDKSMFHWIVAAVREQGLECDRTIIYCKSIMDCATLFLEFGRLLQTDMYIRNRAHTVNNRLVAMYHHSTPDRIKEFVLQSMLQRDGIVRVVIATTALSMGVNFPDIRNVVQFGPPKDPEEYLQQIGRAGRDGEGGHAILYWSPRQLVHTEHDLKVVARSEDCIRSALLAHFQKEAVEPHQPLHGCCSRCHMNCMCAGESCAIPVIPLTQYTFGEELVSRVVTPVHLNTLRMALEEAQLSFDSQVSCMDSQVLDIKFSDNLISDTLDHAKYIFSLRYILENLPVYRTEHAMAILDAIQETLDDFVVTEDERETTSSEFEEILTIEAEELYSVQDQNPPDDVEILEACDEFC